MKTLIISYLYAVFFIIAFFADNLPFLSIINSILQLNKGSLQTIGSNDIEDSKKQEILLANSLNIFKQTLKLTGLILLVAIGGFLLILLSGLFSHQIFFDLFDYMKTINGLILSVISFLSYFLIKKLYVKFRL